MKFYIVVSLISLLVTDFCIAQIAKLEFGNFKEGADSITAAGVLIDDQGTLATVALHAANPEIVSIKDGSGKSHALKLLAHDSVSRMTLLHLPEDLRAGVKKVSHFTSTGDLNPGDELMIQSESKNVAGRMVSYVREFDGRVLPITFIKVSTNGFVVEAGQPIIDKTGALVGLSYQPTQDKNSFYLLPSEVIMHLNASSKNGKFHKPCWVGVSMDNLVEAPVIIGIRPDTPASRAGLLKGDIVIKVNNKRVNSYPEVVNAFYFLKPGEVTPITVIRGVELLTLKVTPEVNPVYK